MNVPNCACGRPFASFQGLNQHRQHAHSITDRKYCSQCGVDRPKNAFYLRKTSPVGLCKACIAENAKVYRKSWSDERRSADTLRRKTRLLPKQFGITIETYNEMHAQQNGVCAICGKTESIGRSLAVDHNHITGKVRGLLCFMCNTCLGYFEKLRLEPALFTYLGAT